MIELGTGQTCPRTSTPTSSPRRSSNSPAVRCWGRGPGERGAGDPRPLSERGAPESQPRTGRGRRRLRFHHQRRPDGRPGSGAVRPVAGGPTNGTSRTSPSRGPRSPSPTAPATSRNCSTSSPWLPRLQRCRAGAHPRAAGARPRDGPVLDDVRPPRYPNDGGSDIPEWPAYQADRDNFMALTGPAHDGDRELRRHPPLRLLGPVLGLTLATTVVAPAPGGA